MAAVMAWLDTPTKVIRSMLNYLPSPKTQPSPITGVLTSAEAPTAMGVASVPVPAPVAVAAQKKPNAQTVKVAKVKTEPERRALRVRTLKKGDLSFRSMERRIWKVKGEGTAVAPFVLS